jgi:hypothetical protein
MGLPPGSQIKIVFSQTSSNYLSEEENDLLMISKSNEKEIDRDLYALISKQDYNITEQTPKGDDKIIKVSVVPIKIKEIIHSIKSKAPKDNKFLQNIWNETKNRLYFKNGYYDFKEKKFIKGQFNRTPIKIYRNYNDSVSSVILCSRKVNDQRKRNILTHVYNILSRL